MKKRRLMRIREGGRSRRKILNNEHVEVGKGDTREFWRVKGSFMFSTSVKVVIKYWLYLK